MKKILTCAVLCLVGGASAAEADAHDRLEAGMSMHSLRLWEGAITAYTDALAAPDLPPQDRYPAYKWRGHSYLRLLKCKEAVADFDDAIKLKQDDTIIFAMRDSARACAAQQAQ